jgi:hypothetical protein
MNSRLPSTLRREFVTTARDGDVTVDFCAFALLRFGGGRNELESAHLHLLLR